MDNKSNESNATENVLFGAVGAFLFSLVGGALYVLLSRIGYIASLSGLVGVVCAIKGYAFFTKSESKRGIVISVVIAAIVLVIAWYIGFCLDMIAAYKVWFESGEAEYVPKFFEYVIPFGFYDLAVNPACFIDLFLSLALGAVGCGSYVKTMLKKQKAAEESAENERDFVAEAATGEETVVGEQAMAEAVGTTETEREPVVQEAEEAATEEASDDLF